MNSNTKNEFQKWMLNQGYKRESGSWVKAGILVTGKELSDKLNEWKSLNVNL